MTILDIIFLVVIGVVLFRMLKPSTSSSSENNERGEEGHLSETQRRWREMKHEQELDKMVSVANENATKYEQIVKLQIEMQQYILDNKRQFHPLVWIFDTINPRMVGEYIKHLAIMFGIFLLIASFAGWTTMLTFMLLLNVIMVDFLIYRRQLMLEVTEWNPEFQEKFTKKFKNLIRGIDIP